MPDGHRMGESSPEAVARRHHTGPLLMPHGYRVSESWPDAGPETKRNYGGTCHA